MNTQKIKCPFCAFEAATAGRTCPSCGKQYPDGVRAPGGDNTARSTPANSGEGSRDRFLLDRVKKATHGRFDIIRQIGRGGMAAVYHAFDVKLDRRVAVKVMLPQLEATDGAYERFVREARTAARLSHNNIVTVYDVMEVEDMILLVMNLIDGASLEQVVPHVPRAPGMQPLQLPVPVVKSVLMHVATALEFAHHERVIHRDIKPANVMITTKGDAVLTDFGIAKVNADAALTNSSTLMGTPTYMSPEQWKGQAVSGASDQYSLGVMAYELLVGEAPFIGTMREVQNAHVEREPTPPHKRRTDVSPKLSGAIMRMLAKRPAERFPTMTAALETMAEGYDSTDSIPRKILGAAAVTVVTTRNAAPLPDATPGGPFAAIPPRPARIEVTAPDVVLVGRTFTIAASVKDTTGAEIKDVSITLTSENPDVAMITSLGAVATAPGSTRIVATGGGVHGAASVRVIARDAEGDSSYNTTVPTSLDGPRVASLRIAEPPTRLQVGGSAHLTAMPFNERGAQVAGLKISWKSHDENVAIISETGWVKARRPGIAKFSCECGGLMDTAQIEVVQREGVATPPQPDNDFGVTGTDGETTAPVPGAWTPGPDPKPPKPTRPVRSRKWPWVIAGLAVIGAGVTAKMMSGGAASAPSAPVDTYFGETVKREILGAGYDFGTPGIVEGFSGPVAGLDSTVLADGRAIPTGSDGTVRSGTEWNVASSDFAVHLDARAEVSRNAGGSGLYLGAEGGGGQGFYLILLQAGATPKFRVIEQSGATSRDLVPAEPTGMRPGLDKLDVLVTRGAMQIFINERLVKSIQRLRLTPNGRFGLFVRLGEQYSFDNVVAVPLKPN